MSAGANRPPLRPLLRALVTAMGLGLGALALNELRHGTFWLPGAWAGIEVAAALLWALVPRARVVALNTLLVVGMLICAEGYLLWAHRPVEAGLAPPLSAWKRMRESRSSDVYFYPEPPWASDPVLGSIHKPNSVTRERRYVNGRLIAGVTYSTRAHGFRAVKPADPDADSLLLFGCSMTWGSNIEDHESYPWQLGELLGPRVQVLNFGVAGSGPNTMLATISAGYERESLPTGRVRDAYYVAWLQRSIGHLARVLGRVPWGASAPRYRSNPDASAVPYALADGRLPLTFDQWLTHHSLLSAELGRALGSQRIDPHYVSTDLTLLLNIVREADRLLRDRDQTPLTVLIMTDPSSPDLEREFAKQLAAARIRVLLVRLPPWAYLPRDIHPNALGARMLARVVAADQNRTRSEDASSAPVWVEPTEL